MVKYDTFDSFIFTKFPWQFPIRCISILQYIWSIRICFQIPRLHIRRFTIHLRCICHPRMKINPRDHITEKQFVRISIHDPCASAIDQFDHIDMKQLLTHHPVLAILKFCVPGVQIRAPLFCPLHRLLQPPFADLLLIAGKQHIRHLFIVPHFRS